MAKASKVMKYFDKINKLKLSAKCKMCSKIRPTAGNNSNLHSHLKNIHTNSKFKVDIIENSIEKNNVDNPIVL